MAKPRSTGLYGPPRGRNGLPGSRRTGQNPPLARSFGWLAVGSLQPVVGQLSEQRLPHIADGLAESPTPTAHLGERFALSQYGPYGCGSGLDRPRNVDLMNDLSCQQSVIG